MQKNRAIVHCTLSKPHVAEISAGPACPFYMFSKEEQFGQRIKSSDYSKRGERLAKSIKLDGELAEKLSPAAQ